MKNLHFTQEQVTNILEEIAVRDNGMADLQKMCMEALMRAERHEHNLHPLALICDQWPACVRGES